jgi:hypothetical protein
MKSNKEHRNSKDKPYPSVGDVPAPTPASIPTPSDKTVTAEPEKASDALAVTPANPEIFQTLQADKALTQDDVAFQVDTLSDLKLAEYLRDCNNEGDRFHRVMTTPAAAELMKRFKAAKKRGEPFLGYRNFDTMCPAFTGFTSKQIRNYAKGYKTPPPKVSRVVTQPTAQEIKDKQDQEKLEAETQASIVESKRQADADRARVAEKYTPAQKAAAVADPVMPSNPVNVVNPPNPLIAKTQRLYEEAVSLVRELLDVMPLAELDSTEKEVRKRATDFLNNNCGGVNSVPLRIRTKAKSA